jgi:hypothetical protein
MPFTLAHPAAVLPLRDKWPDGFLALVAGSVGPDIPYFLPSRWADHLPNGHTALTAITVAAPLALALLTAAVALRRALVAPLWGRAQMLAEQVLDRWRHSRRCWIQAIPATIVGCEIHVLWDAFTHNGGWAVLHLPLLAHDLSPFAGYPIEVFRILQYGSSLIGIAFAFVWMRRRLAATPGAHALGPGIAVPAWRPAVLVAVALVSLLVGTNSALRAGRQHASFHRIEYLAATSAVGAFALVYLALGVGIVIARRRHARSPGTR